MATWVIGGLVAAAFALAVRRAVRGGCGCGCGGCDRPRCPQNKNLANRP